MVAEILLIRHEQQSFWDTYGVIDSADAVQALSERVPELSDMTMHKQGLRRLSGVWDSADTYKTTCKNL